MRKLKVANSLIALLIAASFSVRAQDSKAAIRDGLVAKYALTKPTADKTDIVTAGAVLVLQKDDLMTVGVSNPNPYQNTYKNGKITQNTLGKFTKWSHGLPGVAKDDTSTRRFVAGEKIWVTKIDVRDNGVVFELFTDAYSDVRYGATLVFPFPKNSIPPVDQVDKLVAEVFKVQPADDPKTETKQQAPATEPSKPGPVTPPTPQQPSEPTPAPIAPPPPPPADPKTIALKQTTDEVVANFGQPDKIIKLGAKQIYVYKDMKVTFVNGKVTDVQ